ncbi:YjiH family protein [Propioniferax innocua]|uniref:Nucleoside recognition membrane protein YjiH n=1 Tax=Propioniferax innocua TaxID=1753 RepID=A0A542ZRZ7_9ACTN|nr:YjiH family protein [Propioniferax innocua]TQL63112.1 nucleoside recognition membrane protein YjiH [Propioniferax innocua]
MSSPSTTTSDRRPAPRGSALRFLIPSLIGVFLFMVPVPDGTGSPTIPIAYAANATGEVIAPAMPWLLLCLAVISAVGTVLYATVKPAFLDTRLGRLLFDTSTFWLVVRLVGLAITAMIVLGVGPEWVRNENTGAVILDLASLLMVVFALAGLLLPLLLNFGLLDFAGTLMTRIMRPLFRVPGRSSVVGLTSWLGDGTIGVLMINQQYVHGHYTKREAATLGTTFSIVSVTFIVVILQTLGLEHMFAPFYLTLIIAGLITAIIIPRIPPVSRIPDEYVEDPVPEPTTARASEEASAEETDGTERSLLSKAWASALDRASTVRVRDVVNSGVSNALEMWLAVIPIIMAVGTIAVIIAEYTSFFRYLGIPFVPVLELFQVPEAAAASETMVIGFADMLLPAIIGGSIQAEITRFIVGALAVTQLIFMSETGGMLLASKIPLKFHHLVMIFLLRTLIGLPVIVALAHLFY